MNDLAQRIRKESAKFRCEICDYNTSKLCDISRHNLTRKHQSAQKESAKNAPFKDMYFSDQLSTQIIQSEKIVLAEKTSGKESARNLQNAPKTRATYNCTRCEYNTNRKSDFNNHMQSDRHKQIETMKITHSSNNSKYVCMYCNYITNIKTNFMKHNASKKHLSNLEKESEENSIQNNINIIIEDENEEFKEDNEFNDIEQINNNIFMKMFMALVERNEKLENIVLQQSEMVSKQTEILDVISKKDFIGTATTTNNNTTNNNTTNNNTANINIFLNEQCKDAMNMTDFLKTIKYTAASLKHMERNGFANTITKLFTEKLHELSLYERPIHCTDIKREILYIKDNNEWQKNIDDKSMRDIMVSKYIPIMERDNRIAFSQYYRDHPEYNEIGHPEYESYFKMAREVNNGRDKETNDVKIIKNLCKETHLTREAIKEK